MMHKFRVSNCLGQLFSEWDIFIFDIVVKITTHHHQSYFTEFLKVLDVWLVASVCWESERKWVRVCVWHRGYDVCREMSWDTSSSSWLLSSWALDSGERDCVGGDTIGQCSCVRTSSKSLKWRETESWDIQCKKPPTKTRTGPHKSKKSYCSSYITIKHSNSSKTDCSLMEHNNTVQFNS